MKTFSFHQQARQVRSAVRGAAMAASILIAPSLPAVAGTGAPELMAEARNTDTDVQSPFAIRGSGRTGRINASVFAAERIRVTLADGNHVLAVRDRDVQREGGTRTWIGHFEDQDGSILSLTSHRNVITGFLHYGTQIYEVMPGPDGGHVLYEIDESKLAPDSLLPGQDDAVPVVSSDAEAMSDAGGAVALQMDIAQGDIAAAAGYVHDLLVVYTPAARIRYGQSTLQSMIVNAVNAANQAYQASQVGQQLNLVSMQEVSYTETNDISVSLSRLRSTTDGYMDSVHALRDQYGADIVAMVSEDASSTSCGTGYLMSTESVSFASSAFSVTRSDCLSAHTMAHEIGHNQGNHHDRANATSTPVFPYSYGYRRCVLDGTGFRTIMGYSTDCNVPRITRFSNPNVTYNGYATGIAYETSPASAADNARSMNNTADTVAAFRATTVALPTAPSSLAATASSSSQINLSWLDGATNESGFRVERSTDGVNFTEIATLGSNVTSYSSTGLSASTWYWFRVRAYNSAGNSTYSNVASAATQAPLALPAAPSSLVATAQAKRRMRLTWTDNASNETGFRVESSTNQTTWTLVSTLGTNSTSATVTGLRSGTRYYFRVRSYNGAGSSAWSNTASAVAIN